MPARDGAAYRQVAQLHIDCIDQGFLPKLGPAFLALMYECMEEELGAVLLTCERNGRIVGFVTGAISLRGVYLRMLRRWLRLGLAMAPSLVRPKRVLRILEILRYSIGGDKAGPDLPRAELLSLAVDPAWRGKGCAEELYKALMSTLAAQGEPGFRIVVGEALVPAHKFYRRMGAQPAAKVEVHRGEASTVYVHRLALGSLPR